MDLKPVDFLHAARCPAFLKPQEFGLWEIEVREHLYPLGMTIPQTILRHMTLADMHLPHSGEIVMEDSLRELSRHMPIWLVAKGRVLVTGLGLGCVVRGLLANPDVDHIDVVEIDADILRVVGAEFRDNPRVQLHHGDALIYPWPADIVWDYAWHDLWVDGTGLASLHVKLFVRYHDSAHMQGAWMLPRLVGRLIPMPILGMKKRHRKFRLRPRSPRQEGATA